MEGRDLANALEGLVRGEPWQAIRVAILEEQARVDRELHSDRTAPEKLEGLAAYWRGLDYALRLPGTLHDQARQGGE